jgi:glycosyltransferase involved in cell wall biosynthesis
VHTHSSKAGIIGRIASPRGRSAVVHSVHGWGHTPQDSRLRQAVFVKLERAVASRTDALIAVSRAVRDEGLNLGIGSPDLYRVIPEFVDYRPRDPDFDRARHKARTRLGLAETDEVIGWVGRFVAQKDPVTLTATLVGLLRRRPGTKALLVGDGPHREEVAADLARAGLDRRVIFAGLRHDARELYPAFDVLLHPSLWEGQPRVVQEALAERVPVVCARVTGTDDLMRDGHTGFLIEPRRTERFIDALDAVLVNPRLRAPLPDEEIAFLNRIHGLEAARTGHLELYEALMRTRSMPQ